MLRNWKFKNLTLLVCALILSILIGSYSPFKEFIFHNGLASGILAGALFISTFTCPLACAMLLVMAEKYPLPEIWLVASITAVIADFIFFNMVKDHIGDEIAPIIEDVSGGHFNKVVKTQHFRWLFPVIGAGVILSPLPKSVGLNMLGIHKLKRMQFIAISAAVNTVGIAFILLLSFIIKP